MDPGTFDGARLDRLCSSGVNRVSIGVQSFSDDTLKLCGRAHSSDDVYRALQALSACNRLKSFSLDLISALPHLSIDQWEHTLSEAIQSKAPHISIYDLQVEDRTAFSRWYRTDRTALPSDSAAADMYRVAVNMLNRAGYEHYEVSNYALPGHRSQHNQRYWRCKDTLAFGQGAASYFNHKRFSRPSSLQDYTQWIESLDKGEVDREIVDNLLGDACSTAEQPDILEYVMLALRTSDGFDLKHTRICYGDTACDRILRALRAYIDQGLVQLTEKGVRLSDPDGFLVSNDIISTVFAAIS
jgi:coproporphyrinogen III oxidase-like Fe-S oxidoreductase